MATTTPTTFNKTALANGTSTLTQRSSALATSTDLVQAGATFNDSTRLLDGGLWSTPNDNHNQPAYLGMYTSDLHAVLNDISGMLATPGSVTLGGAAYALTATDTTTLTQVEGQIQSLISDAPLSIGTSAAAIATQTAMHSLQTSILNEIQGDTGLATALGGHAFMTGTGATNVGFQQLPTGTDTAADLTAATATGAHLSAAGNVFNAAADLAVGGLNTSNLGEFAADIQAVATGVQNILNSPTQLTALETGETGQAAALTTVHLQTVENELQLQLNTVNPLYATNPNVAARETNDNLLDIIDIVQTDAALNKDAGGAGTPATTGGFAEQPSYLKGTITHFQDNQAETNFWANFITEANVLGAQTVNVTNQIAAGTLSATSATATQLISEIQTYEQHSAAFDQSVGGVFSARFDNELLNGTLQADSAAAINAIQTAGTNPTAAVSQAAAAAQGFIADAADVSGNNIPVGGGTFNSQVIAGVNGAADTPNPMATVAAATTPNGVATQSADTTAVLASAAADPIVAASTTGSTTGTGTTGTTGTGTTGATGTTTGTGTTASTGTTGTTSNTDPHSHHDHGHQDFGQQDFANFDHGHHWHWG